MEPQPATGRDIRRRNRSALLSELFFHGPLSRLDLAGRTGLSPATASNVTADLMDQQIIVEAGRLGSDGGRPRVLLRVDPRYGYVVGVAVAETDVRVELFDLAMNRLAAVVPRPVAGDLAPATASRMILAGVREVTAAAGIAPEQVLGVGVGVPGIVEEGPDPLVHALTVGWDGVPLARMLAESGLEPPVFLENGAKTLGQAEMWFGAGRGAGHAVVVLIGSGVGAAVVTGGATYRGVSSSAGEWGHTTIMFGGRSCRCGAQGCLEAYVGAVGVLARYREASGGRDLPGDDEASRFRALLDLAGASPAAAGVLDETADLLGAGIADLVNLFNPELVVLGGWAGQALAERMLPRIRAAARRKALPHPYAQVAIEPCAIGDGGIALGAATLPIAALLSGSVEVLGRGAASRPGPAAGLDPVGVQVEVA